MCTEKHRPNPEDRDYLHQLEQEEKLLIARIRVHRLRLESIWTEQLKAGFISEKRYAELLAGKT